MLLIPVGQEPASTRRIPWVTCALMVATMAAFTLTGFGTWNTPFKAAQRNEEALAYFMEHPYLTLRPEVEKALLGDDPASNRSTIDALKAKHPTPEAGQLGREQAELDRFMAGAFNDPGVDPFQRFGLVPAHPQAVAWVTHLFLHTTWLALLANLFLLYLVAPFLEDLWGRALFTGFYILAGVVAAGAFVATQGASDVPFVGAAGAVAACFGALLAHYRLRKVPYFYWAIIRQGTFEMPAWLLVAVWVGCQAFVIKLTGGAPVVLLAGFAVGALAGFALSWGRAEKRRVPAMESKAGARPVAAIRPAVFDEARKARQSGDLEIAISLLRQHLAENPGDHDTVLALWDVCVERGSAADVAPAMKGIVKTELQNNQLDLAAQHWVELIKVAPTMTLDTASLLKMVPPLTALGRKDDALAVLRRALLTAGSNVPFATALRIAALGASLDSRLSRSILQLVLARESLDPNERNQAEKLLGMIADAPQVQPKETAPVPTETPAARSV